MKVLLVTPFFEPAWAYGGMARATAGLAHALARLGHHVLVVTTLLGDAPAVENAEGLQIRRFRSLPWLDRRLFPWPPGLGRVLAETCAKEGVDVGHIAGHRHGLAAIAGRALRNARVPWILQPHGTYPHHGVRRLSKQVVDRLFGRALVDDAAALLAVSDAEARDLPRPACVIPNGVAPVGTPRTAPRPRPSRRLLFVGSDAPQKRGRLLVPLLEALPDAQLDLVGRFGETFRGQFQRFPGRVLFRGVLAGDSLASAYAEADLLLQPAVGEAFGLVAFEAAQVAAFTRRDLTWEAAARATEALYAAVTREGRDPQKRALSRAIVSPP
jgi:glycosyltransferase involved in cell wall biosynthesis